MRLRPDHIIKKVDHVVFTLADHAEIIMVLLLGVLLMGIVTGYGKG